MARPAAVLPARLPSQSASALLYAAPTRPCLRSPHSAGPERGALDAGRLCPAGLRSTGLEGHSRASRPTQRRDP